MKTLEVCSKISKIKYNCLLILAIFCILYFYFNFSGSFSGYGGGGDKCCCKNDNLLPILAALAAAVFYLQMLITMAGGRRRRRRRDDNEEYILQETSKGNNIPISTTIQITKLH